MNVFLRQDIADDYDAYYDEFDETFDKIEKDIIGELINGIPREKMIDLGSGAGHWTQYILSEGFRVKGNDVEPANISPDAFLFAINVSSEDR